MNKIILSAALLLFAVGCTQVEHGTGKALGNANSVVTTYAPKVWGPGENGSGSSGSGDTVAQPTEEEKKRELEKQGS